MKTMYDDVQVYLFKEEKSLNTHSAIRRELKNGKKALYISKKPISAVQAQFEECEDSLSIRRFSPRPEPDCISQLNVDALFNAVNSFVNSCSNSIIVINGLDSMKKWVDFEHILILLTNLKKLVAKHGSVMLITVDPNSLDSENLSSLESVVDHIVCNKSK